MASGNHSKFLIAIYRPSFLDTVLDLCCVPPSYYGACTVYLMAHGDFEERKLPVWQDHVQCLNRRLGATTKEVCTESLLAELYLLVSSCISQRASGEGHRVDVQAMTSKRSRWFLKLHTKRSASNLKKTTTPATPKSASNLKKNTTPTTPLSAFRFEGPESFKHEGSQTPVEASCTSERRPSPELPPPGVWKTSESSRTPIPEFPRTPVATTNTYPYPDSPAPEFGEDSLYNPVPRVHRPAPQRQYQAPADSHPRRLPVWNTH